jgi:hypothetical protein
VEEDGTNVDEFSGGRWQRFRPATTPLRQAKINCQFLRKKNPSGYAPGGEQPHYLVSDGAGMVASCQGHDAGNKGQLRGR